MAEKLEAILLRLGMDASGFTKGSREARKELGAMEKGVGSLKGELSSLASQVAAGVGFAVLTNATLEFAEACVKVSEQTGLSIESVQFLRFAADQTGTSVDALAGTVNKLQRQLVEAGDNDKLRAEIEALVGPLEVLRAMSPEDQLNRVAAAIAGIHDPAERTTAAVTLMGKSGADAIPEMVALAEKSDELAAAFERTGGAVSAENIAKVEELGDAFGQAKNAAVSLATELLAQAAPALVSFLTTTTEVIGGLRLLDGQGGNAMVNLSNKFDDAAARLERLRAQNDAFDWFVDDKVLADQEKLVARLREELELMTGTGKASAMRASQESALSKQLQADNQAWLDSLVETMTTEEALRAHFGEIRFAEMQASMDAETQMRIEALRVRHTQERAEEEAQVQFLKDLQASVDSDLASGIEEASQLKITTWQQDTTAIAGLLEQQTAGVARHSKAMFELNKAAGIVNTIINTVQAVTKAWADYGWPVGAAVGAAIAVAGAAQVQAIASAKFGQKTAPSQAAQPAVPTGEAQGAGGGGSESGRVLRVEGITASSLLTGTMVRQIANAVGDHVRDGGKVEWAN